MIQITLNNYEAFYLDYFEGKLSTENVAALLLFLEQHPHLKVDFDSMDDLTLSEDAVLFEEKSLLKDFSKSEQLMIGAIEQINSSSETAELNEMLHKSTVLTQNFALYQKTILRKEHVVFPAKNKLKRSKGVMVYLYPIIAVAAALILLFNVVDFTTNFTVTSKVGIFAHKNFKESNEREINSIVSLIDTTQNDGADSAQVNSIFVPTKKNYTIKSIDKKNKIDESFVSNNKEEIFNVDSNNYQKPILIDTSIVPIYELNDKDEVADNSKTQPNEITIRQYLSNKIRKNVFKEEAPSFDNITGNEILANISSGLNQITNKEVIYVQETDNQKEIVSFSIGKFEFYRSKTK